MCILNVSLLLISPRAAFQTEQSTTKTEKWLVCGITRQIFKAAVWQRVSEGTGEPKPGALAKS